MARTGFEALERTPAGPAASGAAAAARCHAAQGVWRTWTCPQGDTPRPPGFFVGRDDASQLRNATQSVASQPFTSGCLAPRGEPVRCDPPRISRRISGRRRLDSSLEQQWLLPGGHTRSGASPSPFAWTHRPRQGRELNRIADVALACLNPCDDPSAQALEVRVGHGAKTLETTPGPAHRRIRQGAFGHLRDGDEADLDEGCPDGQPTQVGPKPGGELREPGFRRGVGRRDGRAPTPARGGTITI